MANGGFRAFCNTSDLHKAIIGLENQLLVFFLGGRFRQVLQDIWNLGFNQNSLQTVPIWVCINITYISYKRSVLDPQRAPNRLHNWA